MFSKIFNNLRYNKKFSYDINRKWPKGDKFFSKNFTIFDRKLKKNYGSKVMRNWFPFRIILSMCKNKIKSFPFCSCKFFKNSSCRLEFWTSLIKIIFKMNQVYIIGMSLVTDLCDIKMKETKLTVFPWLRPISTYWLLDYQILSFEHGKTVKLR